MRNEGFIQKPVNIPAEPVPAYPPVSARPPYAGASNASTNGPYSSCYSNNVAAAADLADTIPDSAFMEIDLDSKCCF